MVFNLLIQTLEKAYKFSFSNLSGEPFSGHHTPTPAERAQSNNGCRPARKNSYATGLGMGNKFLSVISWGERGWNIVVSNSEFEGLCCRPINSEIAAIMSALRELQLSQSTSSVSPRSEQKALAQEITKVVFHLSSPSCRLYVFVKWFYFTF